MVGLVGGLSTGETSLLVLAIGAGSLFFSHVNDAGFWLVKEYFGMTVGQTVKSWSLMETVLSVTGLVVVMFLGIFIARALRCCRETRRRATATGDAAIKLVEAAWPGEIVEADRDKRVEQLQLAQTLDEIRMRHPRHPVACARSDGRCRRSRSPTPPPTTLGCRRRSA